MDIVMNDQDMDNARKAAWIMRACVEGHPNLFMPYIDRVISYRKKEKLHDAIKRNALILLKSLHFNEKQSGILIDLCFGILQSAKEPIAVKAHAVDIIYSIGRSIPEINHELKIILEDQLPYYSPGLRNKAQKVIILIGQQSK